MGANALSEIRKLRHLSNVPVVAMTANAITQDRQRCLDSRMNDCLVKQSIQTICGHPAALDPPEWRVGCAKLGAARANGHAAGDLLTQSIEPRRKQAKWIA